MAFSIRAGTNWCHDFPKLARESGFYFNMHKTRVRVDWNRISTIDIDRVIQERDFHTIDENVNNVVDYYLESEYDVKILDPNFVKLFRLAQLSVEYLLYCKQYLDHSVVILKDELRLKLEENTKLKKELSTIEENMKEMKEKFRDKHKYIETKLSDSHGEIHKCPQCPKTFISAVFMNSHITRRHSNAPILVTSPVHEQYRAEAEKLHSEIKNLKERLNETERVIRNDSGKLFETIEFSKVLKNSSLERSNYQDQRIEEEHRKYREEISNLKSMLFSEIRSLKESEKKSWDKFDHDDYSIGHWKELLREQENEIQRLKDNLQKRSSLDIASIQSKLDAQENCWQSKMENMNEQHRMDIEKLYTQLKLNEESSRKMREDYLKKIELLEGIAKKQANSDRKDCISRSVSHRESLHNIDVVVEEFDNESDSLVSQPIPDKQKTPLIITKPINTADFIAENDSDKIPCQIKVKDRPMNSRLNASRNQEWKDLSKFSPDRKHRQIQIENLKNKPVINEEFEEDKKRKSSSTSEEDSQSRSESNSNSENSESESEETIDSNEEENSNFSQHDKHPMKQQQIIQVVKVKSKDELKQEIEETFYQKLKDLGVDPDWRGIPHLTFKQLTQIIKHHRDLKCKKFPKFDETKRKIIQDIYQKILLQKKENKNSDESIKKSPLNRLMRNVKTKAFKALSIHSQESTPRENIEQQRPLINKFHLELLPKKLQSPCREVKSSIIISPDKSGQSRYTSSPRRKVIKPMESSNDSKQLSHSYESIKDYLKDSGIPSHQIKSPINLSGTITTSTPQITETNINSRLFSYGPIQQIKTDGLLSLPSSPKNNKSVLKTTTGSAVSLVKKKVLFDLETDKNEQSEEDKENLSESDVEISSISEESSEKFENIRANSLDTIILKTSQSEKIAEISRKIETQLSLVRQKPFGSVESPFMKELNFTHYDNKETDLKKNNPIQFMISPEPKKEIKLPLPAPRSLKMSFCKTESKESNLDKDIDELLQMK